MPAARTVRRILVALDASPASLAALEAAARLAAQLGAELAGLYVEDESLLRGADLPLTRVVGSFSGEVRPLARPEIERQLRVEAEKARRAIESVAARSRLRWTFRVTRGSVTTSLDQAAAEADILSLGRGRAPSRVGHTAASFLKSSGVPVLLLDRSPRPGRAIVAVFDGEPSSVEALELGQSLAELDRAPLIVVIRDGDARMDELEHEVTNRLAGMGAVETRIYRLGRGDPATLARLNRSEGIGMLVLGRELALGRGIAELLRELGCPLLVVRRAAQSA